MGFALILAMQLATSTFQPQTTVPVTMVATDCGGKNVSPNLTWSDAPKGAKSFALVLHDPDAPRAGGFYHWVLYNLPPSTTHLDAGASLPQKELGTNSTGSIGYFGPCPPPGKTHHYILTVYALDTPSIDADTPLTAEQLLSRIKGHVLAQASLIGLYAVH
jgi:Raf kinase inhibitor-like YbhB/YbcL family protein